MFKIAPLVGKPLTVLVTAAGGPPGINTVRALEKVSDIRLICADLNPEVADRYPMHRFHSLPPCSGNQDQEQFYCEALLSLCRHEKVDVLLPCIETEILVVAKNKNKFAEQDIALALSDYTTLLEGIDKLKVAERCQALGLPCARTLALDNDDDLEKLEQLGLPFIVKPRVGYGSRGIQFIESMQERANLKALLGQGYVAQTFVPSGKGSNYMFSTVLDGKGHCLAQFQSKSTQTLFAFGGPATAGKPVHDPVLVEYGQRLAHSLPTWRGVANFEFLKCRDTGQYFFVDLNPRVWGYSSLAEDSGISFPILQVLVAAAPSRSTIKAKTDYMAFVSMSRELSSMKDYSRVGQTEHLVWPVQGEPKSTGVGSSNTPSKSVNASQLKTTVSLANCNYLLSDLEAVLELDSIQSEPDLEASSADMVWLNEEDYMLLAKAETAKAGEPLALPMSFFRVEEAQALSIWSLLYFSIMLKPATTVVLVIAINERNCFIELSSQTIFEKFWSSACQ